MEIIGYDLLGEDTVDGLRFAWKCDKIANYVESAAFTNRSKGKSENICGYTTSVSAGCILRVQGLPCAFCRTGNVLPYGRLLTCKEIAQQNVFMVLADMLCEEHPELRDKEREFAYMGQGEPGFSYAQVRMAIEITNQVMRELGQKVCRHIFATCGIPESIKCYKDDVENYFTEKVTLHLSVHSLYGRDMLMPINRIYPIQESISLMKDIRKRTGEKPCIGIMLFNNFSSKNGICNYKNDVNAVLPILDLLDPEDYRLSFCEYNPIEEISESAPYCYDEAREVIEIAQGRGFEAKYFSSFGKEKKSACGMLGRKEPDNIASQKWKELNARAVELVNKYMN